MSALAEQHETYIGARERLGLPVTPVARVRRRPVVAAEAVPEIRPELPTVKVETIHPAIRADILALLDEDDNTFWRDGVKAIIRRYGETARRMVSHQRDQNIVECRFAIATYLRQRGWSYPRIGEVMNRDHSSIIHLLNPTKRRDAYRRRVSGNV